MKRAFLALPLILAVPLPAACSPEKLVEKFTDEEDRAMAESLMRAVRANDLSLVKGPMHRELEQALRGDMEGLRSQFPKSGVPKLVSAEWETSSLDGRDGTLKVLRYEVGDGADESTVEIRIFESGDRRELIHLSVQPAGAEKPF